MCYNKGDTMNHFKVGDAISPKDLESATDIFWIDIKLSKNKPLRVSWIIIILGWLFLAGLILGRWLFS